MRSRTHGGGRVPARPALAAPRDAWPRRIAVPAALCCLLACLLAGALAAGPAKALVARAGGRSYGVTLRAGVSPARVSGAATRRIAAPLDEAPLGGSPLRYHGGPVMHSNTTHVIYWDPEGEFTATTEGIVDGFFSDVAHDSGHPTNVFAVDAQYTDSSGGHAAYASTAAAPLTDSEKYPTSGCTVPKGPEADTGPPYTHCLTDEQLQSELSSFIAKEGLPKGSTQLYFLLLPHRVVTCFEAGECSNNIFCAYHSFVEGSSSSEIIYADIPFSLLDSEWAKGCQADGITKLQAPNGDTAGNDESTRFADVAVKYISHEYSEAITDPRINAWLDEFGFENGDKCNQVPFSKGEEGLPGVDKHAFTPTLGGSASAGTLFDQLINEGHFYLQSEWDNGARACTMQPVEPRFTSLAIPAAAPTVPASFGAEVADPYGTPEVSWEFGDGSGATGTNPSHTYGAAGTYTVRVTAADPLTGAHASTEATITVASPLPAAPPVPPPPPPPPPTSAFHAGASFDAASGSITLRASIANPGALSWLGTFANGRFGAFASARRCKKGRVLLRGRCRPARIVFARGQQSAAAAGSLTVVLKPSRSGLKALRNAAKRGKGLPVTVVLTFRSSAGAPAVAHSFTVTVKLRHH